MLKQNRAGNIIKEKNIKMKRAGETTVNNGGVESVGAVNSDLSILRKPIKTSVTGFNEARKAYDDGTEEVSQTYTNKIKRKLNK